MLTSCVRIDPPINYTAAVHKQTDAVPDTFVTMLRSDDALKLQIQGEMYDDTVGEEIWTAVRSDVDDILSVVPDAANDYIVYVVRVTPNGDTYRVGNRVYCTMDQIRKGLYQHALISVMTDARGSLAWQTVGIYELVFGEGDGSAAYDPSVSIDPPYFIPDFAGEEQAAASRRNAAAHVRQTLSDGGYDALFTDDSPLEFNTSTEYPILIKTRYGDILQLGYIKGELENAADVTRFIAQADAVFDFCFDYISREAPELETTVREGIYAYTFAAIPQERRTAFNKRSSVPVSSLEEYTSIALSRVQRNYTFESDEQNAEFQNDLAAYLDTLN